MESVVSKKRRHIGSNIQKIRSLRGLSQEELGERLEFTKQVISKIEQSEEIEDEKLQKIADALGVTFDGLKSFDEESMFSYTANFYDNATLNNSAINCHGTNLTINNPIEKIIEIYENMLKIEREKIELLKSQLNCNK